MPWVRFYAEGEPVEEVHKLIEANMRIPRMTFGDLGAQVAACSVAERALQALATRYGAERLAQLEAELIDYTERLVRQEILTWPDGTATFTDYLGSDGIEACDVPITATVTIAGRRGDRRPDRVGADGARLAQQHALLRARLRLPGGPLRAHARGAEHGRRLPARRVLTKPGTVAEVVMPGASSMRGVTGFRVLDALNGALAQLIPDRVPAAGEGGNTLAIFGADRPGGGDRYVFYELIVGTWGGTPTWDGNDGLTNPASLAANIPIEVAESEFPIVIERYGLVPDTGGAGEHRGGLAIERVWRCLTPDTSLIVRSDRADRPPYGLAGGGPGATSSNVLQHPDGTEEILPAMFSITIEAGDVYVHRTAGGGGWGDPFERDPVEVAADVANGKVSVAAAREHYGVVVGATARVDRARDGSPTRREERCVIRKGGRGRDRRRDHGGEHRPLPDEARLRGRGARREAKDLRRLDAVLRRARAAALLERSRDPARGPRRVDVRERRGGVRRPRRLRADRLPPLRAARGRAGAARHRPCAAELRRRDVADRARGGRAPLARAPARGRRARVLRADLGLREPGADRRVARPLGRARARAPRLRGLRGARDLEPSGGRVTGVVTGDGEIATGVVVNACGPWGDRIGRMAGIDYPITFSREHEAIFDAPEGFQDFPVISDVPQRLYCRPYVGGKVLVGEGWPKEMEPADPETYDDGTDEAHVQQDGAEAPEPPARRSAPTLTQPDYGGAYVTGYSGVYDITEDWYPIVGEEELGGYYSCFGGSGHGFKIGPAIGESLAAVIAGQEPPIDISSLSGARFSEGRTFGSVWGPGNRA